MGSNLARDKIFTASIGSVDSLYLYIYLLCESVSVSDPVKLESNVVCEIEVLHF